MNFARWGLGSALVVSTPACSRRKEMKKKIVAAELNIFNKKVKQKILNAGGKDIFPSSIGISIVLEITQERLRKQQWVQFSRLHPSGYQSADM